MLKTLPLGASMSSIHSIEVTTIDGQTKTLADYAGKTLLIVNVASKCGLTPQYEQLEALYKEKKDQGLEILGFPSNEFKGQEPGSNEEIAEFCRSTFGIDFPMFSKICVNGEERHPLYQELFAQMPERTLDPESGFLEKLAGFGIEVKEGQVAWNFEKFLVDGEGKVIGHFAPDVNADNPILTSAVEAALA